MHYFFQYIYFFSLHVSGNYLPIIRSRNSIYATLGVCHSVWMTVWYAGWIPLCITDSHPQRVTNKYQVSHRYSYFSWWWAHSRPKHVLKGNKYTKKNCAPSWPYLQHYPLSYGVPVRERYGSTLLPATREQHDQNCTQSH